MEPQPDSSSKDARPHGKRAPGMRRGNTDRAADRGVRAVADLVEDELDWIFREQPVKDYGIDAHAEIVADDDLVTGRLIALQIKSGPSWFNEEVPDGWVFRPDADHISYWLGHSIPVVVVLVKADRTAYWEVVSTSTVTETKKAYKLTVPREQQLDRSALAQLLEVGGRSETLVGSLYRHYRVLPPDTVANLRRAAQVDSLAAAQLADRLSTGRMQPTMTAASITAARPTWLENSEVAQDLWMAVAAYAGDHEGHRAAADAFERAAEAEGPRSARALAFAGLSLVFDDRSRAPELFGRARDGGQILLADVGFMILAIPVDVAGQVEVPQSIREASEAELDSEPTVLNFLGEVAVRRGDLNAAITYRQRAVDTSSEPHSGIRLELARNIWQRAMKEGSHSPQERRRAIAHAQAAVEDRRRWAGPSAEAVMVLVEIQLSNAEYREAVKTALPTTQGGTALEIESVSEAVAHLGALAALGEGNNSTLEFFKQVLPTGPRLRELTAIETDAGLPLPERIAMWTELAQESKDDAATARFVSKLVRLGVWPAAADSLVRRSILPSITLEILRAEHLARTTDRELGVARLRELISSDSQAVHALVALLEEQVGPEAAIRECEEQIRSRTDPTMMVLLADLLRRHHLLDRAEEVSAAILANDALSVDIRLEACKWLLSRKVADGQYTEATRVARIGLAVHEDPDLAWNLLAALHGAGDVVQARAVLARYKPVPTTDAEIRLWMQLHIGVSLSADDALLMVDLVRRLPPGDLRSAIIGHLVSEVFHAPTGDYETYSPSVAEAVKGFAEEISHDSRGVRKVKGDDASLQAVLAQEQADPVAVQHYLDQLRSGLKSSADIAQLVRVPYGAALLQSPAGVLFASDLTTGLRRAGEAAANEALDQGSGTIDLSAIHLLTLLDNDDKRRLKAAIPRLIAPWGAVGDAVNTRATVRGLAIATFVASLSADGTVERTKLSPTQRAILQEQAEALEVLASGLIIERADVMGLGAAVEAIALANKLDLPLWCDDAVLRQTARGRGVRTFSTVDLLSVLSERSSSVNSPVVLQRLAFHNVVDLPLTPECIVAVARLHDWEIGPAHVALSRPGWWRSLPDWESVWRTIAAVAAAQSRTALVDITKAALAGAVAEVGLARGTQRYQQLVVATLVTCHEIGVTAPPDMLELLAHHAVAGLPPKPGFVLASLIQELRRRSVEDAVLVGHGLLPGVTLE
ncbi:DUF4365 domain-containing protein [Lentzea sp. NPDC058436]|uniref:DUF4365 domain-containing protein n=1 Tax=Lentzea sp. NPDC058436 TaxID=3346499 RepID=UPI00364AA240